MTDLLPDLGRRPVPLPAAQSAGQSSAQSPAQSTAQTTGMPAGRPTLSPRRTGVRPDDLLTVLAAGAAAVTGWPIWLALRGPQPVQAMVVLAHVCGMLAGYGVVVLVGLMSRTPALERGVGADRLARWHSRAGRGVVLAILVHAWAAVMVWRNSRAESFWPAAWHVLRLPGLIAATVATALFLLVAVLSVRAARRRVSHEAWHTVHLLVYVAVALGFLHQLGGPDLAGHRILQVAWALLYTSVFTLVAQHRLLTPLRNATRHRLRVQSVVQQAPGVVSVVVEGVDLQLLQAESGQFFRWRFLTPDLWKTAHPFSLSAAPTSTQLRLTVKALGDGSTALQRLEPGTWVLAEGPYGAITAARRTRRHVLLLAAGVGITPMRALFETMPLAPGQDLLLLYRARSRAEVIFGPELEALAARSGARVHYLLGDQIGPLSAELFGHLVPDLPERDVYLCGPPGFSATVRRSLKAAGLPADQLHEERFDF
ncbi:ferredoxin reductase family protein [Jatrophihabitans telluris]|uniref:Ferredoxin reductase family protein n=1 Tax=Jatrophihabitans telluris TaxID=2038343 RepID=A0ABY4QUG4_9ACTN|nr:ferredoxin reductase family protein [Jatrophihabitans telluris]UQX86619.1 ferredoxin reductase family protein [Jatrophihabitans telluris]